MSDNGKIPLDIDPVMLMAVITFAHEAVTSDEAWKIVYDRQAREVIETGKMTPDQVMPSDRAQDVLHVSVDILLNKLEDAMEQATTRQSPVQAAARNALEEYLSDLNPEAPDFPADLPSVGDIFPDSGEYLLW